jgi:hypothetical protein
MDTLRRRRKKKATTCSEEEEEEMLEIFFQKILENVGSTFYKKCWFNFLFEKCCFNFFLKNVVIFVGKMLLQHFLKNVNRQMLATIPTKKILATFMKNVEKL